eukprot:g1851.t1
MTKLSFLILFFTYSVSSLTPIRVGKGSVPDREDSLAFFWKACESGKTGRVRTLLNSKQVAPNDSRRFVPGTALPQWTCLHMAAANGHMGVVKELLKHDTKLGVRSHGRDGWQTPLMVAVLNGNYDIARLLHNTAVAKKQGGHHTADMNAALREAATEGHLKLVQGLLGVGADPNAADVGQVTAVSHAALAGESRILKELLRANGKIDQRDIDGQTPLHRAAQSGDSASIEILLSAGAKVNAKTNSGWTPLMMSANSGRTNTRANTVSQLLSAGAEFVSADENGRCAFMFAVQRGDADVVDALLAAGADFRRADSEGMTPLMIASHQARLEVVEILLENGADVHKKCKSGRNALAYALYAKANKLSFDKSSPSSLSKKKKKKKQMTKSEKRDKIIDLLRNHGSIWTDEDEDKRFMEWERSKRIGLARFLYLRCTNILYSFFFSTKSSSAHSDMNREDTDAGAVLVFLFCLFIFAFLIYQFSLHFLTDNSKKDKKENESVGIQVGRGNRSESEYSYSSSEYSSSDSDLDNYSCDDETDFDPNDSLVPSGAHIVGTTPADEKRNSSNRIRGRPRHRSRSRQRSKSPNIGHLYVSSSSDEETGEA